MSPGQTLIRNVLIFDGERALAARDVLLRGMPRTPTIASPSPNTDSAGMDHRFLGAGGDALAHVLDDLDCTPRLLAHLTRPDAFVIHATCQRLSVAANRCVSRLAKARSLPPGHQT